MTVHVKLPTVTMSIQPLSSTTRELRMGSHEPTSLRTSLRISGAVRKLAMHLQKGETREPHEFLTLCYSLTRTINYAVFRNEIPETAHKLPSLLKQVCQGVNDEFMQTVIMVVMTSVKNACHFGWFQNEEREELLVIANEMQKISNKGDVTHSNCHSTISAVMERFYPKMKLGHVLASVEVSPGDVDYGIDFVIVKNSLPPEDKICLLVAQKYNIETFASIISPQKVDFTLNGNEIEKRIKAQRETGPQMPTNVTSMLRCGTNLLQVTGQFDGHYVILVASMSETSLPENLILQDYIQPVMITSLDSDYDIIEGPTQLSLNCPISFKRIQIPVKGRSCKHFQCFDFHTFIGINSRTPYWRCPLCNQHVNFADIRLDQNMVEVLKQVGDKNIEQVIIHADGSWKPVILENDWKTVILENDCDMDNMENKVQNCEQEQADQPQLQSVAEEDLDLFNFGYLMEMLEENENQEIQEEDVHQNGLDNMRKYEPEDKKPVLEELNGPSFNPNSTSMGVNSVANHQNLASQENRNSWLGLGINTANGWFEGSTSQELEPLASTLHALQDQSMVQEALHPSTSEAIAFANSQQERDMAMALVGMHSGNVEEETEEPAEGKTHFFYTFL